MTLTASRPLPQFGGPKSPPRSQNHGRTRLNRRIRSFTSRDHGGLRAATIGHQSHLSPKHYATLELASPDSIHKLIPTIDQLIANAEQTSPLETTDSVILW